MKIYKMLLCIIQWNSARKTSALIWDHEYDCTNPCFHFLIFPLSSVALVHADVYFLYTLTGFVHMNHFSGGAEIQTRASA